MWIIKHRVIFYTISAVLVIASLAALAIWGVKPGIDFTGGTLIEIAYPASPADASASTTLSYGRPDQSSVAAALAAFDPTASVRPGKSADGLDEYIVRMRAISQEEKSAVISALTQNGSVVAIEKAFDSIGPVLGDEAAKSAIVSIILVILGIVLYITFAFRKVSEPVASWKYGLVAIAALIHDVIIPTGVFAVLGYYLGYEVDTLFVTALLVILGFSVHDTIVVFDRVRENLRHSNSYKNFSEIVGRSVSQTFIRSINTSLTTLIALVVLYVLGGSATEHFTLALIIGIAAGTYSSIFIGSPLLVTIEKWGKKK